MKQYIKDEQIKYANQIEVIQNGFKTTNKN